jgi:rubrerythrin
MTIRSALELHAHAIAIEREAAARYTELAVRMHDEGREDLARVFDMLARLEGGHRDALLARTAGVLLPAIPYGQYRWLGDFAPETAAHDLVMRLLTPRAALGIALQAEQRALAFFEGVFATCHDPALRALAREMAAEEQEHAALIELLLEGTPDPQLASTVIFAK